MRMIPDSPYRTKSRAEKKVFDDLRRVFSEGSQVDFTCYHSLNLTRHAYKRFGEIDFLICSPHGLYVLEVKGGRVVCKEGEWQYINKHDEVDISREGPFRQAESALHGLVKKINSKIPESITDMVIGYGVVLPHCELGHGGAEWDPQIVFDKGTKKSFQNWLESLFSYWRKKDPKRGLADPEALKLLRQYLRPNFEAVVPLYSQVGDADERIAKFTEDQMMFVDIVAANPRVLCSGGAGTGKTFMALELARRWTGEELNIVLVCRSPWLKNYLKSNFAIPNLTVTTVDGLKSATRRQGLQKFDGLIVDEGQDLLYMENLDTLDSFIEGGLSEGRWCFFHDVNNQSGFFGNHETDAIEYLKSLGSFQIPLSTNCRNTQIILDKIKGDTGADMGVRGAGMGPTVRESFVDSINDASSLLAKEIDTLVNKGGLSPGQVTILSPHKFSDSSAASLANTVRDKIVVLDEFSMQKFPPVQVSFSSIKDFKGLENEAIIVVDLRPPSDELESLASHYVAMSRAKAILSLIYLSADK
jgi:hypothetical protein